MNKILALLAIAVVAIIIYNGQKGSDRPPEVGVRSATVQERLDALLSTSPVDARQLAVLVAESPAAARAALRNRALQLTGTVHSFHLTGSQRDILKVTLEGAGITRVCVTFNPRKHNTTSTYIKPDSSYEIVGPDVLFYSKHGQRGQVMFQKGGRMNRKAFFEGLAASEIQFIAE